jgi:hypothetical protein
MRVRWLLLVVLAVTSPTLAGTPDRNPFAGHNAYPFEGEGAHKLEAALAAGLKHVEVDVTYDPRRQMIVVTHDKTPSGGEPDLVRFIEPVWRSWAEAPGRGYTLIIELKSRDPRIAAGISAILKSHAALLSRMRQGGAFEPGKITVCLTGSEEGKDEYPRQLAPDEPYLAFADRAYGPLEWKWNPANYVPSAPPGFRRFVTCAIHNFTSLPFKEEPQPGIEAISQKRLQTVADLAASRGYALRVYTINAAKSDGTVDTRLWKRCVDAHVPMIATDDYKLASDWWASTSVR